jgi:hypothetical protein
VVEEKKRERFTGEEKLLKDEGIETNVSILFNLRAR